MTATPTLFNLAEYEVYPDDFCPDDWETPCDIARPMARLLLPSDRRVLEPAAGTGQIARWVDGDRFLVCNELNPVRFRRGEQLLPAATKVGGLSRIWTNTDFLQSEPHVWYDTIISNPPFSLAVEFLETALTLLNPDNPSARVLFLLPIAFFSTQERCDRLEALDCRIYQRHRIRGRLRYLKNGIPVRHDRQCDDCVYDFRPSRTGDAAPERVLNPR